MPERNAGQHTGYTALGFPKAGATLKIPPYLTVSLVVVSFLGFVGLVVYLAAADVLTRQMAILLVVALLGCYIGFGILIGVYRLINKLD